MTEVFEHPKSWRLRFAISAPLWIIGGLTLIALPVGARTPVALPLVILGVWALLHITVKLVTFVQDVTITPNALTARKYFGREKTFTWQEIREISELRVRTFEGSMLMRISGRKGSGSLVFTDAMENFPRLVSEIERRSSYARRRKMSSAWRLVFG